MTKILFVRKEHVYLPEISAYKSYLAKYYPSVQTFESTELGDYSLKDFDIIWHFMGADFKGRDSNSNYVVHEYNSLSTMPFAKAKNYIKSHMNTKPNRRVFLNEIVLDGFGFDDDVPYGLRDMGVDDAFFDVSLSDSPEYDFICVGGLNRGKVVRRCLRHFAKNMKDTSLLLVGDAPDALRTKFQDCDNIIFKGRVSYEQIPSLMANARYGLNLMPDIYPFNIQTATKVLEYAAVGLPIITTDYKWANDFEVSSQGRYFKLSSDMSNLSLDALDSFDFLLPDVSSLRWSNIIEKSGIFSFL